MILTPEDFLDRPFRVPNQEESSDFSNFIEVKETELLINLLGYELYLEFKEALEGSGDIEDKWTELRDGADYTYNEKLYRYGGLVDLLRPAIFSLWMNEGIYKFTNSGWLTNNPALANNAGPVSTPVDQEDFRIKNWNEYVRKAGVEGTDPKYLTDKPSFYGFMKANEEDYEEWVFTSPCFENRFSL